MMITTPRDLAEQRQVVDQQLAGGGGRGAEDTNTVVKPSTKATEDMITVL